ncbi:MAG: uncharacterized protein KVP18_001993 [Porospora cf. gigantea A]|uniref:uncharacterized protein n=1 Tax=Porospora cf. gigantea A TaxID=2853593 RepID=UPI0035599B91|nr:MAG: hypothetical protein KVP18_001993 [Porospora cf. gigantea A]
MDGKLKREIMEENQISIEMGKDVPNPVPVWDYQSFDTPLQELIAERDFVMPRPVQVLGIPVAMSGRDLIAVAETGSGKTLAFVLPGIVHLEDQPPVRPGEGPVMLVLAPTRELCQQIAQEANFFAEPRGHRVTAVYGGQGSVQQQIMALSQGSAIVVATPGRLQDLVFKRSIIDLKRVTFFVLDEADRMLDMGFIRDMQLIAKHIRADRQTLMFSATWPRSVDELAKTIFRQEDPIKMKVGYKDTSMHLVPSLTWQFINAQRDAKRRQLESILKENYNRRIIVFCNRKADCDYLSVTLGRAGIHAAAIHGDKSQQERDATLYGFRKGDLSTIIATDVISRGIDIPAVSQVIMWELPAKTEDLIHRAGRTARAGCDGLCVCFYNLGTDGKVLQELKNVFQAEGREIPNELMRLR